MYDVAILGGGPGGYVAALRAAARGAKVCCVEADRLGGACLNVGCIPTKTMLHASRLLWDIRSAGDLGLIVAPPQVDQDAFLARVANVVTGLGKGVEFLLKARKVDVVCGRGRLIDAHTIAVETSDGTEDIAAESLILATGSRAARPSMLPWDSGRIITTDEATTAAELPESVLILGGGVIGCEFATIYSELGIPTTIVEMLDSLAAGLDQDAGRAILKSLEQRDVRVHVGTKATAVTAHGNAVTAELDSGESVAAAMVLAAVGRTADIDRIGLEDVGIETDGGVIVVDDRCRTNLESVYAVGDVAETRQYAHLASRMGVIAADNATGHEARDSRSVVPSGVYTHPQVATVGMSEHQARDDGRDIRVGRFPYVASGMAQIAGQTEGQVKILAEADGGKILGGVVIGPHATEVIHEIALAMHGGLTVEQVAETIHAHPSFSEAVGEAADAWMDLALHGGRAGTPR